MDLTMSIASAATSMKQTSLMNAVSIKMMDKAMDTQKAQATSLVEDMSKGVPPSEHLLDTRA